MSEKPVARVSSVLSAPRVCDAGGTPAPPPPPPVSRELFGQRPVRHEGLREMAGYRMKVYSVRYGSAELERGLYEEAMGLAESVLPRPAVMAGRYGVGFVIWHQGRGMHYLVMNWWARENELPGRIWVREFGSAGWRPAAADESVCVWDLEIIWFERNAFVEEVLSKERADVGAYLARVMNVEVG